MRYNLAPRQPRRDDRPTLGGQRKAEITHFELKVIRQPATEQWHMLIFCRQARTEVDPDALSRF